MTTPRLGIAELAESQDVPEETINEAFNDLEIGHGWYQIESRTLQDPPATPAEGDAYIPAATATGAWAGHEGEIAYYYNGAWKFRALKAGFGFWVDADSAALIWNGTAFLTISTS